MESLRMRVVEAGARAAQKPYLETDDGRRIQISELLTADHPELLSHVIEAALDAMLDCLTENADEWEQGAAHKLAEPVQESAFVAELLDLLRPDRSP